MTAIDRATTTTTSTTPSAIFAAQEMFDHLCVVHLTKRNGEWRRRRRRRRWDGSGTSDHATWFILSSWPDQQTIIGCDAAWSLAEKEEEETNRRTMDLSVSLFFLSFPHSWVSQQKQVHRCQLVSNSCYNKSVVADAYCVVKGGKNTDALAKDLNSDLTNNLTTTIRYFYD